MKHIHSYYSPNDLYNKIIKGLDNLGKDLSSLELNSWGQNTLYPNRV